MMANYLLGNRNNSSKIAAAAGLTALAGVALICAIPQTRRACGKWIGNMVDGLKNSMSRNGETKAMDAGKNWEKDLAKAEKLKGPVQRRKDTSKINVPSAGTSAWRDEWSSE